MKNIETPLEGIKVLDLTRVLSGPYATMMLGDLGADIIKLEQPITGDDSRHFGPFIDDESAYFNSINRNKKSIVIDLKKEEGKDLFLKLVKEVDVVVENFRPGTMEKLGLGYEVCKELNEKIIFSSISGFGQTGPFSKRAAYDGIVQAMGGIMGVTGEKGGKPVRVGPSVGDIVAGMFCAYAILAAYIERNKTGIGKQIDVSMLDSQVAILENAISRYFSTGVNPAPEGNVHQSIFPFETFKTATEEIYVAAGNNQLFKMLCEALNVGDLLNDPRFNSNPNRGINREEMVAILEEAFLKEDSAYWIDCLSNAGVPCSKINKMEDVVNNPQVVARKMIKKIETKGGKTISVAGSPIRLNNTDWEIENGAPVLGEHSEEILKDYLNLNDEEIKILKEGKII